ncbi:hypothetical protein BRD05_09850 [Halobacteriales archaeon QS_9_70_65]|nr:MAG: hypothetical protein BRD05_09850 [Halobacteriales archaeon QS_9_70_65]
MTVAAETREAVRDHPFLETALRAGIVNYTAAARFLDVGEEEAVAAALRRYAADHDHAPPDHRASVSMRSGVGPADADADAGGLLSVGGTAFAADGGDRTAVLAEGDVGAAALADVLGRLRTAGVGVEAAAAADGTLAVVVGRRDGADAVRAVEAAL